MKKSFILLNLLIVSTTIFFSNCSKTGNKANQTILNVTITSITPSNGGFGTVDTITGVGIDQFANFDSIVLNGKKVTIVSKTNTQLIIDIPTLAGTGTIKLWSGGSFVATPVFTYDTVIFVTTLAGSGNGAVIDGKGLNASFNSPKGIAVGPGGNLFVIDNYSSTIRKITPDGTVTTFAGTAGLGEVDGQGTNAGFLRADGIACDSNGYLYVSDYLYIRKISPTALVSTLAGNGNFSSLNGQGTIAGFNQPVGMAVDKNLNVYVGDEGNKEIRKITPAGYVSTYASGNYDFTGIAIDNAGNIYVADNLDFQILHVTPNGIVSSLAGSYTPGTYNGIGNQAQFASPTTVAIDANGFVYVADGGVAVRKINPLTAQVTTYAGGGLGDVDGPVPYASFRGIYGIAIDSLSNVYVTDGENNKIRKIQMQ